MPGPQPYLSVVATARNDNHGGDLLYRIRVFVNGLVAQCERHAVPAAPSQLQAIAQGSGGRFFKARSAASVKQVYKDLGSRLAREDQKREITRWWTLGAIVAILVGALLSGIWFRRLV